MDDHDLIRDQLDLMRDEFNRIMALVLTSEGVRKEELIGICERAISGIEQTVPLILQRDNALRQNAALRRAIQEHLPALKQMAGQIISPKDNTFSRMVKDFETALGQKD